MCSLPVLRCGNDRLLGSSRVEHRVCLVVQCSVVVVRVGLATNIPAVVLLHYASRSCRGLQVGMVIAGGLHGFVMTNRNTPFCVHMKWHSRLSCFPTTASTYELCSSGLQVAHGVYTIGFAFSDIVVNGEG